ncbi:MAG TPA: hypothetical protein VM369_04865 [Candidatus Binatia bacterium]|nr:hypothetical protein [Candidatus Binatia bacterium]
MRFVSRFVSGLGLPLAALLFAAAASAAPSFGTVVDNLDLRKNTKLHAQEYWKGVKGEEVNWSGTVYDVKGGRRKAKIYLADRSRPLWRGYNLVVNTYDLQKAGNVKKGGTVRFHGVLDSYSLKDAGAVIEVEQAELK